MPGIKSIEVQFKGGLKALRQATINWTCWSWSELNQLMPHFLAHGKTVMLEWGWVYDTKSLGKLPTLFGHDEEGYPTILADVYKNYSDEVKEGKGDFDMMAGVVSNFEFTTRDDGAFDCTTIITSVGVSILDATQPNNKILDPSISYNLSVNDTSKDIADKLRVATNSDIDSTGTKEKNPILETNTNVTLKAFIQEIDRYIVKQCLAEGNSDDNKVKSSDGNCWIPNNFIACFPNTKGKVKGEPLQGMNYSIEKYLKHKQKHFFVRWGWFEDNVLSKFMSLTSEKMVLTEFRSVDKYKSVMIANSPHLETTNINTYILPGQLRPLEETLYGDGESLAGDKKWLHDLASIVNESDNFEGFPAIKTTMERIYGPMPNIVHSEKTMASVRKRKAQKNFKPAGFNKKWMACWDDYDNWNNIVQSNVEEVDTIDYSHGYLRNMLINTKIIKEAFGVSDTDTFTVESVSILEAMESLFSLINRDISFWNLQLEVDSLHTYRVKIVDDHMTGFDFNKTVAEQTTGGELKKPMFDKDNNIINPGVFFFPVWSNDSIVKKQNITAKIPSSQAITAMYGGNMDQLKEFDNPGNAFGDKDKESIALAGIWNEVTDKRLEGLGIAFRNTPEIGTITSLASENLKPHAGRTHGILDFLNSEYIQQKIKDGYTAQLEIVNNALKTAKATMEWNLKYGSIDSSIPYSLPTNLTREQLTEILKHENARWGEGTLETLLSSKFLEDGTMKPLLRNSVKYLTIQHGVLKKSNQPLNIQHLELELDIDGTGGIYPGNSFHSTYLPAKYQKKTVFQMFEVNHTVDGSGWTTSIRGKMRATLDNIFDKYKTTTEVKKSMFDNLSTVSEKNEAERVKGKLYGEMKPKDVFAEALSPVPIITDLEALDKVDLSRLLPWNWFK
jgi:hypothetical protein